MRSEFEQNFPNANKGKRPLSAIDNLTKNVAAKKARVEKTEYEFIPLPEENPKTIEVDEEFPEDLPDLVEDETFHENLLTSSDNICDSSAVIEDEEEIEIKEEPKKYLKFRDITSQQIHDIQEYYSNNKNLRATADHFSAIWDFNLSAKIVKKVMQIEENEEKVSSYEEENEEQSSIMEVKDEADVLLSLWFAQFRSGKKMYKIIPYQYGTELSKLLQSSFVEDSTSELDLKTEIFDEANGNNNQRNAQSLSSLMPKNTKLDQLLKLRDRTNSNSRQSYLITVVGIKRHGELHPLYLF